MLPKTRLIGVVGVLLTGLYSTGQSQELTAHPTGPRLTRCTPSVITPGMWVKVEGYRIVGDLISRVKVLFVQDGDSYIGSPDSGSRETVADSQGYPTHVSLAVPEGLNPGKCEIIVETEGVASAPLVVEVADSVSPAVISNHKPLVAQPGDHVCMSAVGVCESDEIELIDSEGQTHLIVPFRTSEGIEACIELPNLPGGRATFRVVEKHSGLKRSNSLSLRIDVDSAPLVIYLPIVQKMNSLAPGQWIDAVLQNRVLVERAELIEVAFTQNESVIVPVQPFKPSENSRLHVQVPTSLLPGPVKITTRTWIKGRASSWSAPVEVELLEHPAAPRVWGIYHSKTKGVRESVDFNSPGTHTITARAGDTLVICGQFLVESVTRLLITLEGPGNFALPLSDTGDQARLSFTIPETLKPGEWQLVVINLNDAVSVRVPVTLVIE